MVKQERLVIRINYFRCCKVCTGEILEEERKLIVGMAFENLTLEELCDLMCGCPEEEQEDEEDALDNNQNR